MSEKSGAYGVPERRAPRLLERVHEAARRRYFSTRTEEAYVHWIKRFIYFSGRRHPAELGEAEVTAFLNHLAVEARGGLCAYPRCSRGRKCRGFSRRCRERSG